MKRLTVLLAACVISLPILGQDHSAMLENALSSVVTVAVYKNDYAKQQLGSRGAAAPEEVYKKALLKRLQV